MQSVIWLHQSRLETWKYGDKTRTKATSALYTRMLHCLQATQPRSADLLPQKKFKFRSSPTDRMVTRRLAGAKQTQMRSPQPAPPRLLTCWLNTHTLYNQHTRIQARIDCISRHAVRMCRDKSCISGILGVSPHVHTYPAVLYNPVQTPMRAHEPHPKYNPQHSVQKASPPSVHSIPRLLNKHPVFGCLSVAAQHAQHNLWTADCSKPAVCLPTAPHRTQHRPL